MAKRRKKRAAPRRRRARAAAPRRRRSSARRAPARRGRRRSGRSGGSYSFIPPKSELYDMAGAGVYGFLEGKAKKDDSFFLNKIGSASPIKQLGLAGNVALGARILNHFARQPLLGHFAAGTACVAIYQMARQGALFTSNAPFTVSGDGDSDDDVAGFIDDETMGALAADADAHELEGLDDEMVDNIEMAGEFE